MLFDIARLTIYCYGRKMLRLGALGTASSTPSSRPAF
jgi:hypothetical protein